ncbi:MAG TPA: radical SAM family heme chaperone HemW [Terriglobia bacterium]|nr:radical SAM family heme chaperone HemW [Terriglobia bacterium]
MQPLGIYVQIPFCASKCSFCNFSSRVESSSLFDRYSNALEQEIDRLPADLEACGVGQSILALPVDTVYFGGGTPPLLGAERLERIVRALRGRFGVQAGGEFTIEVTPGSAGIEFLARAMSLGINRLSIGAQTFEDQELRAVGRLHSAADTRELVRRARGVGFANVSLDLVAGLPHQTGKTWRSNLEAVLRLAPQHISLYLFEIDHKSRLGREVLQSGMRYHAPGVPGEEFMADAYESGREVLGRVGYIQYEISNFALPGYESRHNLKYWRLAPYVGLGAGAHSFDGINRWANEDDAKLYIDKLARMRSPIVGTQKLSPQEQVEEFFFLGLRLVKGINLELARKQWGKDLLDRWQERIEALTQNGLLTMAEDNFKLAENAYLVSNEVFQEFVEV